MAILVCEGRCSNGTVQAYDAMVRNAVYDDKGQIAVTPEMRGLRKQFVYTEHIKNGGPRHLCTVCGKVRLYGEPLL